MHTHVHKHAVRTQKEAIAHARRRTLSPLVQTVKVLREMECVFLQLSGEVKGQQICNRLSLRTCQSRLKCHGDYRTPTHSHIWMLTVSFAVSLLLLIQTVSAEMGPFVLLGPNLVTFGLISYSFASYLYF